MNDGSNKKDCNFALLSMAIYSSLKTEDEIIV